MKKLMNVTITAIIASSANAIVIYDTLYNEYTNANGNCEGGWAVFGGFYEMQLADDFTIAFETRITAVTVRNVTFGVAPASQARLRFLSAGSGNAPGAELNGRYGDLVRVIESEFDDTFFDADNVFGRDVRAEGLNYTLPAGTYWVGLQAVTEDWHYTTSGQYGMGLNAHGRDFMNYDGDDWYSFDVDLNMRVEGDIVPEPMTMIAVGGGLVALIARRRRNSSSLTDYNWRKRNE